MLTKKQLKDAARCCDGLCELCSCNKTRMAYQDCIREAAKTALAYREMLERLTRKTVTGKWTISGGTQKAIDRLAAYEDCFSIEESQSLAQAKVDGRVVVLPCKVGDIVYTIIDSVDMPYVKQEKVIAIELWSKNGIMTLFVRTPFGLFDFGKTVFLTREAAEKALGGVNEDAR